MEQGNGAPAAQACRGRHLPVAPKGLREVRVHRHDAAARLEAGFREPVDMALK
jgi:hypothetical protein